MGKTFSTGLLTNALFTDASNNVGIGAAPSGSYKLEVTGTAKVTTSLTVSSTANASLIAATNSTTGYAVLDLINNGASGKNYQIGVGGNAAASGYANNLYFDLVGVGTIMTLTSGRNVGIGTNSTGFNTAGLPLVVGSGSGNTGLTIFSGASSSGSIHFADTETTGDGSYAGYINYSHSTNSMQFGTTGATPTERMRITSGGNVGIGNTGAADQRLSLSGVDNTSSNYALVVKNSSLSSLMYIRNDGYAWITGTAWNYGSDYRLKENIYDVENGLDVVLKMKPKHFDYIDGQKDNLGFIAQDVQEIIPQAVSVSNKETGMLALKTDFLVPYLVKAIQEQNQIIQELNERLNKAGL
jgi:hypothetical protein